MPSLMAFEPSTRSRRGRTIVTSKTQMVVIPPQTDTTSLNVSVPFLLSSFFIKLPDSRNRGRNPVPPEKVRARANSKDRISPKPPVTAHLFSPFCPQEFSEPLRSPDCFSGTAVPRSRRIFRPRKAPGFFHRSQKPEPFRISLRSKPYLPSAYAGQFVFS